MRPTTVFTFLIAASLIASFGAAFAKGGDDREEKDRDNDSHDGERHEKRGAHFEHGDGALLLRNDKITIWFQDNPAGRSKPVLRVVLTDDEGNKSGYRLELDSLCEVAEESKIHTRAVIRDADENGSDEDDADDRMELAWEREAKTEFAKVHDGCINLHPARDWDFDLQGTNETLLVTMSNSFRQGNVTLLFHLEKDDGQVKFDVKVDDWRWINTSDRLALKLRVLERGVADGEGEEKNNLTFSSGFVSWASTATATYPDGHSEELKVDARVRGEDGHAKILLVFNGTGGYSSLDYDPTLGIQSSQSNALSPVPSAAAGLIACTIALSAGLLARRRK
jgi:hypothetical protein